MMASGIELEIVATNALTGEPVYFRKEDMRQDGYDAIKASCCVPFVNRPYAIDGVPYYDGGVSDPVPLDRAFAAGCDRVVLILTRPLNAQPGSLSSALAVHALQKEYPKTAEAIARRNTLYAEGVKKALALQEQGKVLIVAPDDISGMKTLTKDREAIVALYHKGFADAEAIRSFLD